MIEAHVTGATKNQAEDFKGFNWKGSQRAHSSAKGKLTSPDPDFDLDLHQTAHTPKISGP